MNERINELRRKAQAGAAEAFPGDIPFDPQPNLILWDRIHISYELLAELMLEDVLNIVGNGGEFCSRPKLIEQIKEHFGVEDV